VGTNLDDESTVAHDVNLGPHQAVKFDNAPIDDLHMISATICSQQSNCTYWKGQEWWTTHSHIRERIWSRKSDNNGSIQWKW
jgi:hypothetical protein